MSFSTSQSGKDATPGPPTASVRRASGEASSKTGPKALARQLATM